MPLIHRLVRTPAVALACAAAHPLAAQVTGMIPLSVEARGGLAVPAGDFAAAAEAAPAAEISATWHALPLVGVYGAYQRNRFPWDGTGTREHLTDAGFAAGVRVAVPTPLIPIDPWIRAGIVLHQLRGGSLSEDAKAGWEAGAGLAFPLARGLTLTPGVLWTRYQHGAGRADGELLRVRHVRADVGLRLRF
ncbi:MAG TPA: hypothetical protein VEQ60_31000 [Longimicrobium sp.]|nr:hypothetical protein [Longimicrobium sp.]